MLGADILIADDDELSARFLTRLLTQKGCRVRVVDTSERARAACSTEPPDLVLIDLVRPRGQAFDFCRSLIRALEDTASGWRGMPRRSGGCSGSTKRIWPRSTGAESCMISARSPCLTASGSGYPDGLRSTEVPLLPQIIGIVDVFDALTSERPYRGARPREEGLEVLAGEAKKGWRDRALVDAFVAVTDSPEITGLRPRLGLCD